ncbi:MAG: AAA family ATPase [Proteobacteria bacterium]|nr:AAA family ATPase [Pseudomonadota bacterium]
MNEALYHAVITRLLAGEGITNAAANLVEAACQGDAVLEEALSRLGAAGSTVTAPSPPPASPVPPSAYLARIEASGFRGIGPTAAVDLPPGPGLTVIQGRNGSGKSSFAEGLEIVLTGTCRRWADRPRDWQEGWRSLHVAGAVRTAATFAVEGRTAPATLTRTWAAGETDVDRSTTGGDTSPEGLGWTDALTTFRPLLSSRDLAAALERGTSKLYDEMKAILGLAEVTAASTRLADRRKRLDRARKDSRAALKQLLPTLDLEDPRALACHTALKGRNQDLDAVEEAVLGGGEDPDGRTLLAGLRTLANLPLLDLDAVGQRAGALRAAVARQAAIAGTEAARAARLAKLLREALAVEAETDADGCPVCKQPLPESWRETATREADEAMAAAAESRAAEADLAAALRSARSLITRRPAVLAGTDVQGLGSDAADAWAAWTDAPAEPLDLADHLEDRGVPLAAAVRTLRDAAKAKIEALQDLWKPIATRLAAWLEGARAVAAAEGRRGFLKEAEDWIKAVEGELRDARFAPLATQAQAIWSTLRQSSSVDLTQVRLAGTATRRKVELDVCIDGTDGVALGVMSQGELNALALSLFLPRMLLDESPFRFAVIDDPIQSMDPNKVDGLAQVLGEAARTRQIVVLTHDPRLAEALRRLDIDATVLNVARRGESVVEVTPSLDPVRRHLQDARRLVREQDKLGDALASRVVPGLCRMAVEAACQQAVRRRRLGRGESHDAVAEALAEARTTYAMVTLALFDDPAQQADTYPRLANQHGEWAPDLLRTLNKGTHHGWTRELDRLVDRSRIVADGLRK